MFKDLYISNDTNITEHTLVLSIIMDNNISNYCHTSKIVNINKVNLKRV